MQLSEVANKYIPKPTGREVKRYPPGTATVPRIVGVILRDFPGAVRDTRAFVENMPRIGTRDLWSFVRNNIRYTRDNPEKELIQAPDYLWHKSRAGDCKSMTLLVASILKNDGYNPILRLVHHTKDDFAQGRAHIYTVIKKGGREYIIDPVHDRYGVEERYYKKQDFRV